MERRYIIPILATLALFAWFKTFAEAEGPSVTVKKNGIWVYPDMFESKDVARMPHPAKNMYDLTFEHVDTCCSVRLADLMQSDNEFINSRSWEWTPLGICDYGDNRILYCHFSDFYYSAVYAYLNPGQEGIPSALLILAGTSDPWPSVWFEMDEDGITLYNGKWDENSEMIINYIERYVVENGAFKLVSVQHTNARHNFNRNIVDSFRTLLKK